MESRDEDLERLLCPPARRTNRGWIIAGVCAALAAAAIPVRVQALAAARAIREDRPCAAVPELRAGAECVLHATLAERGAPRPGLPVRAELAFPGGRAGAAGRLGEGNVVSLALPLAGIAPGRAHLALCAGRSRVEFETLVRPLERARLRTAIAAAEDGYGISAAVTRALDAEPAAVAFRLYSPARQLIAYEERPTGGAAVFEHRLARAVPFGIYTLEAETPAHRLAQPIEIGPGGIRTLAAWQARSGGAPFALLPEAGVLVAGLVNRVRLAADPEGGATFPVEVLVAETGERRRIGAPDETFALNVPPGAAAVTLTIHARDARGAAAVRKTVLPAGGALMLAVREAAPGAPLAVDLVASEPLSEPAVVEALDGPLVVASAVALLEGGRGSATLALPAHVSGRIFVRAYPLAPDGGERLTWTPATVAPRDAPSLALRSAAPDAAVAANEGPHSLTALAVLAGDRPPAIAETNPAAVPVRVISAPVPAGEAAAARARASAGVFLLACSVLVLHGFASLLASYKRRGLFWFLGILLATYVLTACACRIFGALTLGAGIFFVQRSFAASFRVLPPIGKLSFRWAVPALCLLPFVRFAAPAPRSEPSTTAPYARLAAPPSDDSADLILAARAAVEWTPPGAGTLLFACALRDDQVEEFAATARARAEDLDVSCAFPATLTAGDKGDVFTAPIRFANGADTPWAGTFSAEGTRIDCEPPRQTLAIPARGAVTRTVTITARTPGLAALAIAWEGTTRGRLRRVIPVRAAGELRSEVANGAIGLPGHANPFHVVLPQRTLYGSARLSARVFPGPASSFLALLEAVDSYAWPQAEKDIAAADAAAMLLACSRRTGEALPDESALRARLANALLGIEAATAPDGGLRGDNRVALTARALLARADLAELWPGPGVRPPAALQFLESRMRADGTFRAGEWERGATAGDVEAACLAACALRAATPAPTRAFLRDLALETEDPALLAPLCAACLQSGALGSDASAALAERCAALAPSAPQLSVETSAWLAYALALALDGSEARLRGAKRALAVLSLARDDRGAFPTALANQLALRALLLCTRMGPRLTENEIEFAINTGSRSLRVAPDGPDIPLVVECTEFLRMEGNEIRVDGTGSLFTPYQVVFSYALPWEGRAPSPLLDVRVSAPADPLAVGARTALEVQVRNLSADRLETVYVEVRIPPLLRIDPPRHAFLSGDTAPGAAALLAAPAPPPSGACTLRIPAEVVAAGRAYLQPCAAFVAPGGPVAFSEPGIIDVPR